MSNTGMQGFDGSNSLDPEDDGFDLALDAVYGVRWWTLVKPPRECRPHEADERWPVSALTGTYNGQWLRGRNEARCGPGKSHKVPHQPCGCGFWAYWQLQEHGASPIPVCGIVRGTGRTLIGEKGFRSQYAEIVALHVPRLAMGIVTDKTRDLYEAWMAVVGDRLEQMYPEAAIYETQRAMLAMHPIDQSWRSLIQSPESVQPRQVVSVGSQRIAVSRGLLCANLVSHRFGCPCKVPWISPPGIEDVSVIDDETWIVVSHSALCADSENHTSTCTCLISGLPQKP